VRVELLRADCTNWAIDSSSRDVCRRVMEAKAEFCDRASESTSTKGVQEQSEHDDNGWCWIIPPRITSEVVEELSAIIERISAKNPPPSLLAVLLWMAQSKNLMLANFRPSRTKILRRLRSIFLDHEQFQKVRCSSSFLSVFRSSKRDLRTEDSVLAAYLLMGEARVPMRCEEKEYIACLWWLEVCIIKEFEK